MWKGEETRGPIINSDSLLANQGRIHASSTRWAGHRLCMAAMDETPSQGLEIRCHLSVRDTL